MTRRPARVLTSAHSDAIAIELLDEPPRDWHCAHGVVFGLAGECERCTQQKTLRAVGTIDGEPVGELVPTGSAGEKIDEQGRRWYSAAWL